MSLRRRSLSTWLSSGLLLPLGAGAQSTKVMKIASPVSGDASNEWMQRFRTAIEQRLPGRLRVEVYPSNQLGQIPATVEGVALGTIEMTIPAAGFVTGLEPRFHVLDVPGLFDDVEHAQRVFADPVIRRLVASFGQSKGVEALFVYAASPLLLLTRKPVTSLDDLRGLKIRAAGGAALQIEPLRRFGATALSMPLGDTMSALQNRGLDGMVSGLAVYTSLKYHDVARYLTALPGSQLMVVGLVNRRFLASLGSTDEAVAREEARRAEGVLNQVGSDDVARLKALWLERGGQYQTLPAEEGRRYLAAVDGVLQPMLAANSTLQADYTALREAAARAKR